MRIIGAESGRAACEQRLDKERAAQHYAAIVESSTDAILSKDLNGVITSWNRGPHMLTKFKVITEGIPENTALAA